MDNRLGSLGFPSNISSFIGFESWSKLQSGAAFTADTTLRLDSPGASSFSSSNLKGAKRKWSDVCGNLVPEHASLTLGLGRPTSSSSSSKKSSATACTMSSAKETEEESSMDLGLNFHLNLGNDNTLSSKKPALASPRPFFDLQLSLSSGPFESVITNLTPTAAQHQDSLDPSMAVSSRPLVDDGSTSSCWKFGNLIPSLLHSQTAGASPSQRASSESDPAPAIQDLSSTMIPMLQNPVSCTSGVIHPQHRNGNTKTCQFQGCGKGARGGSGLCIAHGGGRRCQKLGCHKGAEGRTVFCKAHGGGRRCQHLGCTKSAEGRTDYCIAHGGGRRCSHEGCIRAARGRSGLCIRHGGGKRCQRENCAKSAEGYSGLCISHGGGRRCQYPECNKGAQGSTMFCKAHGGGKRCTVDGCTKGAEGSTPFCKGHGGGKRCAFQGGCHKSVHGGTQFCVAHGGGKRCAVLDCTKSARGRTDFCVRHGGGKRCKFEGCGKSAQGSTDFCKAHGGGKRCSWGQPGFDLGAGGPPCDRFARGKIGLCAAHSALVQDNRVHGAGTLGPVPIKYPLPSDIEKMKEEVDQDVSLEMNSCGGSFTSWSITEQKKFMQSAIPMQSTVTSLPEGRVHGGSLLAILAASAVHGNHSGSQSECSTSEHGTSYTIPHSWV